MMRTAKVRTAWLTLSTVTLTIKKTARMMVLRIAWMLTEKTAREMKVTLMS